MKKITPRILTQISRDPNSNTFGSFDRNWWHYKIRDFSSIILQQGGYYLHLIKVLNIIENDNGGLEKLSKAAINFWVQRTLIKGSHEEYYPWEDGYPPLAFSTLSMAKLFHYYGIDDLKTEKAIAISAKKLLNRFEHQAANQQIAGLAALSIIKKIRPQYVDSIKYDNLVNETLKLQNEEGWYVEYDGPDLGYLSVSMDCLWDLYDFTDDERFLISCQKAFKFLFTLVDFNQGSIGMHNARNTDYIVPYGISRFLLSDDDQIKEMAGKIMRILFKNIDEETHFLHSIDDRYLIHYIGHSIARAQLILSKNFISEGHSQTSSWPMIEYDKLFPNAGYFLIEKQDYKIFCSGFKGGITTINTKEGSVNDYGWLINSDGNQYVTHWWDMNFSNTINGNEITIQGFLIPHKENLSTPYKHFALRLLSKLFGYRIIKILKNKLIFQKKKSTYAFFRKIYIQDSSIKISDVINSILPNDIILKAPRFSKRHVASADSFNIEDFGQISNRMIEQSTIVTGSQFHSQTIIRIK